MAKDEAFTYLQKRETSQGIVCECCYNHCNLQELSEYCAEPSVQQLNVRGRSMDHNKDTNIVATRDQHVMSKKLAMSYKYLPEFTRHVHLSPSIFERLPEYGSAADNGSFGRKKNGGTEQLMYEHKGRLSDTRRATLRTWLAFIKHRQLSMHQ